MQWRLTACTVPSALLVVGFAASGALSAPLIQPALGQDTASFQRVDAQRPSNNSLKHCLTRKGAPLCHHALGILYYKGAGVPKDLVASHMWFDLAAAGGDKLQPPISARDAIGYRDMAATQMSRGQIAEAKKRAREWKPQ